MKTTRILVVGSNGQLGTVLTPALQIKYGIDNVVTSDIRENTNSDGVFEVLDATNFTNLDAIVKKHKITQIYHLAAILSANGEKKPINTWDINMSAFLNVLEVSRLNSLDKVFYPSSIAVLGHGIDREYCGQNVPLIPSTVYGISKAAGENWAHYYLRYPGVIGYQSKPGGGTTDYAIDAFYKAINNEEFICFLAKDTLLPMMYMEDAIRATLELMETPKATIRTRTAYNISGTSFSPSELALEIKKYYPDFKIHYQPDFRQDIAASWPKRIVDTEAQNDWGWQAKYNTAKLTENMFVHLLKTI
jgi:threonine 3-dehydrogenase